MRLLSSSVVIAVALTWFGASPARADRTPDKVFAGKIILSDKKFPTYAKSAGAYVAAIKKQSKKQFWEDKKKKGTWKIYFAAFFKKGLPDIEVEIKLYDQSTRPPTMITSFEQYIDERGQTALLSQITLDKQLVGVNKQIWMTIEVGGRTVATGSYKILGEGEHYSGKVDFTEDEANKKNDDDE